MDHLRLQWSQNRLILTRLATLIIGFVINLIIANLYLKYIGEGFFAIYVFIASLPSLLNFLDFGLGSAAYNSLVDGMHNSKSGLRKHREDLSSIFFLSVVLVLSSLVLVGVVYKIFPSLFNIALFSTLEKTEILVIGFLLICLMTPFTISYKILQATNRNLELILLQGLIPCLTLIIVCFGYISGARDFAYLASPISLFVIAIWAFFRSQIYEGLKFGFFITGLKTRFMGLIRHSILSLIALIISNVLFFSPRYILAQNGDENELVKLSFMLMFLISAQSLISADSQAVVTRIRISPEPEQVERIQKATIRCLILAFFISFGMIVLSVISEKFSIRVLTLQEAFSASVLLLLWASQIVTSSVNSQTKNIPFFIGIFTFILIFVTVISFRIKIVSFDQIFFLIMLPTALMMSAGVIFKFRLKIRL
jgi:O-antigen/teichoic acid export membrane protein